MQLSVKMGYTRFLILSILIFLLKSYEGQAQVTGLKLLLRPQSNNLNKYDICAVITDGSASTNQTRIAFASTITIITPTGVIVAQDSSFNPKRTSSNNVWNLIDERTNPIMNGLDYFQFYFSPSPQAFYPNLALNDTIRLFSLIINLPGNACPNKIRLYENGLDLSSSNPILNGADISNGVSIGGGSDYLGNIIIPSILGVSSTSNDGAGSLRKSCDCASEGDVIEIGLPLTDTINVENTIPITKDLTIRGKYVSNRIKKNLMNPIFDVLASKTLNLEDVELGIKTSTAVTRGIHNKGNLNLKNVVIRDQNMNSPNGQTILNEGILRIFGQTRISKS
jgi:hypothetical protein